MMKAQISPDKSRICVLMSNNIGQVKESEADLEISRLEKVTGKKWRKDYHDYLEEVDASDDRDAVKLTEGCCWIIKS